MFAYNIYHSYYSAMVHDSHFRTYSVGFTFFYGDVVVGAADTVVNHVCDYEVKLLQRLEDFR